MRLTLPSPERYEWITDNYQLRENAMFQSLESKQMKRELVDINLNVTNGSRDHRRAVAANSKAKVEYYVRQLERKRDTTESEWQSRTESHTGEGPPNTPPVHSHSAAKEARFFLYQAIALVPAEVVIGAIVAIAAFGKNFGWSKAAGIGAGLALLLNIVFRGRVKNMVRAELPLPSKKTLKRYANRLAAVVIGAAGVFLALRMVPHGRHVLVPIVTTITALALPFLSAIYFELAAGCRELNGLARRHEKEERDLAYARELLANVNRALTPEASPEALPVPQGDAAPEFGEAGSLAVKGAALVLALLLAMPALASPPGFACEPITVKVRPDTSGSPDPEALTVAHRKLQEVLLSLPCLRRIEISGFATIEDVLGESVVGLDITAKKQIDKNQVCGNMNEVAFLWDDDRKAYNEQCNRKLGKIAEREAQVARQKLSHAFSKLNVNKVSPQSCVYQAIAWALAEPRSVIPVLVTDLKHEACPFPDGPIRPLFGAPSSARPIVIVVPSQGDSDAITAMDKRMTELRARVPRAIVIPYSQIGTLFVMQRR